MGRTCPVAVGARLVPTWVGLGTGVALWLGMTNSSPNDTQTALHTLTIEQLEELIDIDRVEGRVKASSIAKIGDIVDKNPDGALNIVRDWMYQES